LNVFRTISFHKKKIQAKILCALKADRSRGEVCGRKGGGGEGKSEKWGIKELQYGTGL